MVASQWDGVAVLVKATGRPDLTALQLTLQLVGAGLKSSPALMCAAVPSAGGGLGDGDR